MDRDLLTKFRLGVLLSLVAASPGCVILPGHAIVLVAEPVEQPAAFVWVEEEDLAADPKLQPLLSVLNEAAETDAEARLSVEEGVLSDTFDWLDKKWRAKYGPTKSNRIVGFQEEFFQIGGLVS